MVPVLLNDLILPDEKVLLHHVRLGGEPLRRDAAPKHRPRTVSAGSAAIAGTFIWLLRRGPAKSAWGLSPKMNFSAEQHHERARKKSANRALIVMVVITMFEICV